MTTDPKDVGAFQTALNDASGKASVLWTTFITFELYLAIAFGSVTHRNLFLEDPIKLPVLNVDLPLVGFFVVAPAVLVIFHFYIFLQLLALSRKANDYDRLLRQAAPEASDRQSLRQRLDSFFVLQFLVGPTEQRTGLSGISLRLIGWITLVGAPVVILLEGQVIFLPYHREWVVWVQRVIILLDIAVIWYFWNRIRNDDERMFRRVSFATWQYVGGAASLVIAIFSICVGTFPGEVANDYLPGGRIWNFLREPLFRGAVDEVTGRPGSFFSSRLVLTDQTLIDPDELDKVEVSRSLRGRDLREIVLNGADIRKADFTGAIMNDAQLNHAKLQSARFGCALTGRNKAAGRNEAGRNKAGGASKELGCTMLQGALIARAQLQGASLDGAKLQGAEFYGAQLQGASLNDVELQGAVLFDTHLEGAELAGANLQGAVITGVKLQGAWLYNAKLQGAAIAHVQVWRARGTPNMDFTEPEVLDPQTPPWTPSLASEFIGWRDGILENIPAAGRAKLMARLSVLDPAPEKIPKDIITGKFWNEVLSAAPQREKRAAFLGNLGCLNNSAPYIARGLIRMFRLDLGSPAAEFAEQLRKGKSDQSACPGVNGFTDQDWAELDELVRH
jgi:uncharacterized protein YjbI with pentapeptide repeats